MLPSHGTLVIAEWEEGGTEAIEFQVLGLQMDLHSFHQPWQQGTHRKPGAAQTEKARLIGDLEVEMLKEKDVVYVRRSDDGSCRWKCGEKFAHSSHARRRAHELRCPRRPHNAIAVLDKQRGVKRKKKKSDDDGTERARCPDVLDSDDEEALRSEMALGARWTIAAAAGRIDSKARYWKVKAGELEDWLKMVRASRTLQE